MRHGFRRTVERSSAGLVSQALDGTVIREVHLHACVWGVPLVQGRTDHPGDAEPPEGLESIGVTALHWKQLAQWYDPIAVDMGRRWQRLQKKVIGLLLAVYSLFALIMLSLWLMTESDADTENSPSMTSLAGSRHNRTNTSYTVTTGSDNDNDNDDSIKNNTNANTTSSSAEIVANMALVGAFPLLALTLLANMVREVMRQRWLERPLHKDVIQKWNHHHRRGPHRVTRGPFQRLPVRLQLRTEASLCGKTHAIAFYHVRPSNHGIPHGGDHGDQQTEISDESSA